MMVEPILSKEDESKRTVSRRRVLRATGAVAGTGIGTALLSTSPVGAQQTLDFGEVAVGSSATQNVSQPNPTDQALPITGIEITGSDADQFSVVDDDVPVTIQANESHTITIQFAPTSTGEKSASVQVEIAGTTTQTAGKVTGIGISETTEQNDGSGTDESTSSSQEPMTDGSTTDTPDDSSSGNADSTGTEASNTQSTADESSVEGSVDSSSSTASSTSTTDETPSIILMLDFNNNGVIDLQDIRTLIRIIS